MVAAIEVDANRLPVAGGVIERINYDADISGAVEIFGRDGDDVFVLDDNLAPTTIFGDAGNDTFQIGQIFQSFRDGRNPYNGLAEEDYFETHADHARLPVQRRQLRHDAVRRRWQRQLHGLPQLAELFLFGDEDDDTFTVRAFVKVDPNDPKAPYTNINGGQGADFIAFTVNAPVRIDGGDGFDTLTVVGTEFGDDFVVTDRACSARGCSSPTPTRAPGGRCARGQRPLLHPEHAGNVSSSSSAAWAATPSHVGGSGGKRGHRGQQRPRGHTWSR